MLTPKWVTGVIVSTVVIVSHSQLSLKAQAPASLSNLPLLQSGSLTYQGSFTIPYSDGHGGDLSFGELLGLGPQGRTLYWGDHAWYNGVCEVSIPELGGRASIVQRCTSVDEGMLGQLVPGSSDTTVSGVLAWNNKLIMSGTSYYDASGNARYSHFTSGQSFATVGDVRGPFKVGSVPPAAVGGYFGVVPEQWRASFGGPVLAGNCCLSIIWRTSSGPAVSVFDPDTMGSSAAVDAKTLIHYPLEHQLAQSESTNPLFNQTTNVAAVAFPEGSRTVLFFGRHGIGTFCYGDASECTDPTSADKGGKAYPYIHQVWAYDALDLLKVKNGQLQSWQVRPYATWRLSDVEATGAASVSGGTYDHATRRLYFAQYTGGGDQVVHVYKVQGEGVVVDPSTIDEPPPVAPGAPTGLTGQVSASRVDLAWQAPISGGTPTGYVVEAGTAPGQATHRLDVGLANTARVANVPNAKYYIRVRAVNAVGTSSPSNQITATIGCTAAPAKPTGLSATVNGNIVAITWDDEDGCTDTKYQVAVGSRPRVYDLGTLVSDVNTFTATAPPGTYYARVTAVSRNRVSRPSDELKIVVAPGACTPPELGIALRSKVASRRVSLSWSPTFLGSTDAVWIRGYVVEVGSTRGGSQLARLQVGRSTSMTTPAPAGTYYARVRPIDLCGAGQASNEVTVTVR